MTAHLLDVNVLLALCDPGHLHHEAAHRWFGGVQAQGWATCPLTENAFVRIASQPKYPNSPGAPEVVASLLRRFCASPSHRFWPAAASLLDERCFRLKRPLTSGQLTDIYLLGLAVQNDGRLATFDATIPADAVAGGRAALLLIPTPES